MSERINVLDVVALTVDIPDRGLVLDRSVPWLKRRGLRAARVL